MTRRSLFYSWCLLGGALLRQPAFWIGVAFLLLAWWSHQGAA